MIIKPNTFAAFFVGGLLGSCGGESDNQIDDSTSLVGDYHPDIIQVLDIPVESILQTPNATWKDSYSIGDQCYCDSTFDHSIGSMIVSTPFGDLSVVEACELIGPGPGAEGNPLYNDIQCGNGPPNDAGDEDWCPGRIELGKEGCVQVGPTWKFN